MTPTDCVPRYEPKGMLFLFVHYLEKEVSYWIFVSLFLFLKREVYYFEILSTLFFSCLTRLEKDRDKLNISLENISVCHRMQLILNSRDRFNLIF